MIQERSAIISVIDNVRVGVIMNHYNIVFPGKCQKFFVEFIRSNGTYRIIRIRYHDIFGSLSNVLRYV